MCSEKVEVSYSKEYCPKCGYREAVWGDEFDSFVRNVWRNVDKFIQPAEKSS